MCVCQQCGQEMSEDEINIGIGICSKCILEDSTKSSIKISIIFCVITIVSIMFATSFIPLILNSSVGLIEENFEYLIPSLTISIITGCILVSFIIYSIYSRFQKNKLNTNNIGTEFREI